MKLKNLLISSVFFIFLFFSSSFHLPSDNEACSNSEGVFSCIIGDKPFVIKGICAYMRVVTGGQRQLSLSNERFSKFFLIEPQSKEILLNNQEKREAVVYYMDPANMNIFKPVNGIIRISKLDENLKILSGEFEMELAPTANTGKNIKVKQGKLENIPIIYK